MHYDTSYLIHDLSYNMTLHGDSVKVMLHAYGLGKILKVSLYYDRTELVYHGENKIHG